MTLEQAYQSYVKASAKADATYQYDTHTHNAAQRAAESRAFSRLAKAYRLEFPNASISDLPNYIRRRQGI